MFSCGCFGRADVSHKGKRNVPRDGLCLVEGDELSRSDQHTFHTLLARLNLSNGSNQCKQLLRCLIARKWNVDAALEQYWAIQRWRHEHDVDRYCRNALGPYGVEAVQRAAKDPRLSCQQVECFPILRLVDPNPEDGAMHFFGQLMCMGFDKEGHPLYVQRVGLASQRSGEMHKRYSRQTLVDAYVRAQELQQARMQETSALLGRPISKQVVIQDLQGLSFRPDPRNVSLFIEYITIGTRYYPESLAIHFLINTPAVFMGLWRVIRSRLDPATAAKFRLLGSDFQPTLLQHIDADQLPQEYGGSSSCDALSGSRNLEQSVSFFGSFQRAIETVEGRKRCAMLDCDASATHSDKSRLDTYTWIDTAAGRRSYIAAVVLFALAFLSFFETLISALASLGFASQT